MFELLDSSDVPIKFRTFFKLAVYSGFRRGELLGLEWKDIDWENNLISVRRTSNYTADKGIYTDTTKTKKSQRTSKFPDHVMDMLKALKQEQENESKRLGNKWHDTDRLFVKWNGEPMHNNTPYFWFKEFCDKNELRFCDIHSMRHHNPIKTRLLKFIRKNNYISLQITAQFCRCAVIFYANFRI